MITVKPFKGLRPKESIAGKVACPPYDVLSSEEARQMAAANPISFLHINKPEIDLPPDTDPYADIVYQRGRDNLQRFIKDGTLVQDQKESIYVYRLTWRGHSQTGFFLLSSVADYDEGRIKKHELTRPAKEADRTRLIDTMNAQVGPVFLLYMANDHLDGLLEKIAGKTPNVDFTAGDGVRHQLWVEQDETVIQQIVTGFSQLNCTYVADGHHRSAAASNVCKQRREANPNHTGEESYNFFLSAVFPHNQLKILPYNRVVQDLNGLDKEAFLRRVGDAFEITELAGQPDISAEKTFGMYLDGRWYLLKARPGSYDADNVLDSLDVNILMKNLLEPVLGIGNPRTDPRIDFVGGIRGNAELERLVDSGQFKVAFAVYPTTVDALIRIADAGEIMPPKSTWFEPKLRSGMVSYLY